MFKVHRNYGLSHGIKGGFLSNQKVRKTEVQRYCEHEGCNEKIYGNKSTKYCLDHKLIRRGNEEKRNKQA